MKSSARGKKPPGVLPNPDENEVPSDVTQTESINLLSRSHLHDRCILGYDLRKQKKKKTKKKIAKKYPNEVVRFVEGTQNPEEVVNSLLKTSSNSRWKSPKYNTQIRFLEHKYIQCNIVKTNEDTEMILPEEIKPLLINVTFLLHELKQKPGSKSQEDICNVISKIASLLTELTRRPIKMSDLASKPFDEIADKLDSVLQEHNGPENEQYETLLREVKYLEQEVNQKDSEVKYVKQQIQEERARFMPESTSLDDCLRNSIRKNQSLRAEIKYNKAQFRKYEKILAQKEQMRQKSLLELNNLRRKCARMEQSTDNTSKMALMGSYHADTDVYHGGSLTKFIKSKVQKERKVRPRVRKAKTTIVPVNISKNK